MLTIKTALRQKRAVLVGAAGSETAEVQVDDRLRIRRFTLDVENKVVEVHLAYGHMAAGKWESSGAVVTVYFDNCKDRPNPLHDNVWAYFRNQMQADGGELSLTMVEQVIVDRELLVDLIDAVPPSGGV